MTDRARLIELRTLAVLDGYRELRRCIENGDRTEYVRAVAQDCKELEDELAEAVLGEDPV